MGQVLDEEHEHPVASGVGALIGVGLGVGLVLALMALVTSQVLGLGGGAASGEAGTSGQSLYLPTPRDTPTPTEPLITLVPGETPLVMPIASAPVGFPSPAANASPVPGGISLAASSPSVASMQQIDLTGTYPGGQGATLQVQRFTGGSWSDFPVTVSVVGGSFSTYVQTGQTGENRFRVLDPASGTSSNEVVVSVG